MRRLIVVGMLVLAALTACAGPPAADQIIEVTMTDDLRYDPDELRISAGQTVRFVIHNTGATVHEFLVGTVEEQAAFADEMSDGHGEVRHASGAGVSVDPGETAEFSYTFEDPGELLVGCHEPGHYEGGMVAEVIVGS